MCSIEEAWGSLNTGAQPDRAPKHVVQQQMTLDAERKPDVAGQLYTQSDDHRQWAQPADELFDSGLGRGFMAKPAPEANGLSRGVHSKYSREKRFDQASHPDKGGMSKLETDVDPTYYMRNEIAPANSPPAYMEIYDFNKPTTTAPSVTAPMTTQAAQATALAAPSQIAEKFMTPSNNKFTPELITNSVILAEADPSDTMVKVSGGQPVNGQVLKSLLSRVDNLERKMTHIENDKSHDIVLYIVIGIFILFVLDNLFRKSKA